MKQIYLEIQINRMINHPMLHLLKLIGEVFLASSLQQLNNSHGRLCCALFLFNTPTRFGSMRYVVVLGKACSSMNTSSLTSLMGT